MRRLVGFAVLCETLSEAAARDIIPVFFVKGGVAIELRLGLLARATRDLDIGLCAPPNELLPLFDSALDVGFGDFRLRRRGEARARQWRARLGDRS
ncbi:MAG: nucleotidyl transferase AbiEii/AbiGii toxin family protein [Vulcanimicrobiaceae bacterium]